MTDNTLKTKALELAIQGGGSADEVVKRASAYATFLNGGSAPPTGGATGGTTPNKGAATTGGASGAGAGKPGAAAPGAGKPGAGAAPGGAAGKPGAGAAGAGKPGAAAGAKPGAAAGAKPGAAAGAAGKPTAVAGDTKAPGGKNAYKDVVAKLTAVRDKSSKEECFRILAEDGGGAKSIRDLKPAHFDAVVEACDNVLADEGGEAAAGGGDDLGLDDVTNPPERDDFGT